jgi:hypothetical protein
VRLPEGLHRVPHGTPMSRGRTGALLTLPPPPGNPGDPPSRTTVERDESTSRVHFQKLVSPGTRKSRDTSFWKWTPVSGSACSSLRCRPAPTPTQGKTKQRKHQLEATPLQTIDNKSVQIPASTSRKWCLRAQSGIYGHKNKIS